MSHFAHLEVEWSLRHPANRLSSASRFEGRFDVLSVRNRGLGNATSVSAPVADYRGARGYQLASPLTAGACLSALPLPLALRALIFLSISVHLVARDAVICAASYMR